MRTCAGCQFTMPAAWFSGENWRVCRECRGSARSVRFQVASLAASNTLRVVGARSLLRMGFTKAALLVLEGGSWPTLQQARRLQVTR